MQPLTEEQRKFAEEHAGMIWWFINKYHLGFGDIEQQNDWYGEIAEAYLVAVCKYRPEGSFSTFAHACMWKRMQRCLRARNQQKRTRMTAVSLYQPISDVDERPLENVLPDQSPGVEDTAVNRIYAQEMLAQIWPVLTDKHKEALLAKAHYEDAWRQAAKSLNISPNTYSGRIRCARIRIKSALPEGQMQQGA